MLEVDDSYEHVRLRVSIEDGLAHVHLRIEETGRTQKGRLRSANTRAQVFVPINALPFFSAAQKLIPSVGASKTSGLLNVFELKIA